MFRTANNDRKMNNMKKRLRFIKVMNEMNELHAMFDVSEMEMFYDSRYDLLEYSAVVLNSQL